MMRSVKKSQSLAFEDCHDVVAAWRGIFFGERWVTARYVLLLLFHYDYYYGTYYRGDRVCRTSAHGQWDKRRVVIKLGRGD